MSVTEIKQAIGSWTLSLRSDTPQQVLDALTFYGHIAIMPGTVDPVQYGDNLLGAARYVGVLRGRDASDRFTLKGSGMAFWLGDEDDKGDVYETPRDFVATTFPNTIRGLLPSGGSITEGTLFSVAGTYTGKHQWTTPRTAITYVTDLFGAEWRVNNDGTLDAGPLSSLYVTTPKALVLRRGYGSDLLRKAIPGSMSMGVDVEDVTTRVVLLASGEGSNISTGAANAPATPYRDIHGNLIKMTRLVSESGTDSANAAARAQLQLNRSLNARRAVDLSSSDYDIKGTFVVGDYLDVYDPESGFFDANREIYWQGEHINPMALRCVEMTWPIPAGWTVAFRDINGVWIDLSQYYTGETGDTTLVVGELSRGLSSVGGEPVGVRPNLPDNEDAGPDTTIPAAPAFTSFSTGVYESSDHTLSAIQATWAQPLNSDASTITDGDHYELRHRPNAVIGTEVPWDLLSSGYEVDFEDLFDVPATGGFGPDWGNLNATTELTVAGGEAKVAHPSFNVLRGAYYDGTTFANVEVLSSNRIDYAPAGGSTVLGTIVRYVDSANYYWTRVEPNVDQSVTVKISRYKAGVYKELAVLKIPGMLHTPGVEYQNKTTIHDNVITVKVWQGAPNDEPAQDTLNWMDSDPVTGAGVVGFIDWIVAGTTNPLGSVTAHPYFRVRSLTPDNAANAYSWDDLGAWETELTEDFNRTAVNSWGAPWVLSAGPVADYQVSPGAAKHLLSATNTSRRTVFGTGLPEDQQIVVCRRFDAMSTGGNQESSPMLRYGANPANPDYYYYEVEWSYTSASLRSRIVRRQNGAETPLTTAFDIPGLTYSAGSLVWTLAQATGNYHQMKVWIGTREDEPEEWTVEVVDDNHDTFVNGGKMGVRSILDPPNTNTLPVACTYTFVEAKVFSPITTWDNITSEAVVATTNWAVAYVGWDTTTFTLVDLGPGMQYELQIRAVDRSGNFSPWSASSFVNTTGDVIPPSTPAAPEVAASMIAIQVIHHLGKASGGTYNLEIDLHHLDVHTSHSPNFFPDATNKVGELLASGTMVRGGIPAVGSFKVDQIDDIWVKVVAVDRQGNHSSPSDAAQTTAVLIDDAHITNLSVSKLTAGTITADTILAAELEIGPGGNIRVTDGSFDVYDNFGQKKVEAGLLDDGTYDLAAVNPTNGQLVSLSTLAFGLVADESNNFEWLMGAMPVNTWTDLPSFGPQVTTRIGTSGKCLVILSAEVGVTEGGQTGYMGFDLTGPTTNLANVARSLSMTNEGALVGKSLAVRSSCVIPMFGLLPGQYTFTAKYIRLNSGDVYFDNRSITVFPY